MKSQLLILFCLLISSCQSSSNHPNQKSKKIEPSICQNDGFLSIHLKAIKSQILEQPIKLARSDLISILKYEIEINYGAKPWDVKNSKNAKKVSKKPSSMFTANFILDLNSGVSFDPNQDVVFTPMTEPKLYEYETMLRQGGGINREYLKHHSNDSYYAWQFSCAKHNICNLLSDYLSVDELKKACKTSKSILFSQCQNQLCKTLPRH
jgi:hypothetical protein